MQSRVRSRACYGGTGPARFGGIAARAFADQHQAGGPPGLGRQLQATPGGQRQGLFRFGDDKADGSRAQCLLDAPQQIGLALGAEQVQPFADTFRQPAQHRQFRHMGGQDPDQRAGMPHRLK